MKYNTIVFDCDGVILDSNNIKTTAFRKTLSSFDKKFIDEFIQYHTSHAGISRYKKIDYFFNSIIKKEYSKDEYDDLIHTFHKTVIEQLTKCQTTNGVIDYLNSISKTPKIIVSGGDQNELRQVFKCRLLDHHFNNIFGSPDTKIDIISREINQSKIKGPYLYFGDSQHDYEVATHFNMDFIFVSDYTEFDHWQSFCDAKAIKTIPNFNYLK